MKIEKITLGKTIQAGQFIYDRPGIVEATLEPGETMEQGLTELNKRLTEWHKKEYPHLYQDDYGVSNPPRGPISYTKESIVPPIIQQEKTDKIKQVEEIISDINRCESLDDLAGFKLLASAKPEIKTAYSDKLKSLTNATI